MNAPATPTFVHSDPAAATPELVAWPFVRSLVAFDTTSRESNLASIDWVRDHLVRIVNPHC